MLTELKRCNSIGNIDGLLFLLSVLEGKDKVSRTEINNRCSRENGIVVNCPGAIAFLAYLKLVDVMDNVIIPTEEMMQLSGKNKEDIINIIIKLCLSNMVEDGIFSQESLGFDTDKGHLSIKRSAFPLEYAAIRNFLTVAGALEKEHNGEICVTDSYENIFAKDLKSYRQKLTLEELLKQKEEQSQRGLEAEEFVLELERNRLPLKAYKIKRISDFDVAAGYDIVSYDSNESMKYDRFIEVKCYLGKPHFYWSENECDTARQKGSKYILCLVDYTRIKEPGYTPQYIRNPYDDIFTNENWLVNAASYKIQEI
nr:DUF3883 domain-containing protein [uncultured Dorea sp.]